MTGPIKPSTGKTLFISPPHDIDLEGLHSDRYISAFSGSRENF